MFGNVLARILQGNRTQRIHVSLQEVGFAPMTVGAEQSQGQLSVSQRPWKAGEEFYPKPAGLRTRGSVVHSPV